MTKASEICRSLVRAADKATLSTRMGEGDFSGIPYGSLVLVACTMVGEPLLLLSDLAIHTKNLKAHPTVSLLLENTTGLEDPLTGTRVSLMGKIDPIEDLLARTRFLRRYPHAALYAGFQDFNLYRLTPQAAHLVAGFGKIEWVGPDLLYSDPCQDLAEAEAEILAHMNADHIESIGLYANRLLHQEGVGWFMTGIDPEGCDLRRQAQTARLSFETPVRNAEDARRELVKLVYQARRG